MGAVVWVVVGSGGTNRWGRLGRRGRGKVYAMEGKRIGNSAGSGNFEFMWTRIYHMWNVLIGITSWLNVRDIAKLS